MRFCVIGAGAIGGVIGARLALAGEEVTFIARGPTLAAIRADGIRLRQADGSDAHATTVDATGDLAAAGRCDAVVIALKAHQVAEIAPRLASLFQDDTVVIPMQNGLPFWYFHEHGGALAGRAVESVDAGGAVKAAIPAHRIVGCVVYVAAERRAPGHVGQAASGRLVFGELDGHVSARALKLAETFGRAALPSTVVPDIRAEVWLKLWGNLTFNPISALTHATLAGICADEDGAALAMQMMREAQAVAERYGITFRVTLEKRMDAAARVGAHKTSMLQDVEAGRALEVDAVVGSVVELGEIVGVPTPTIRAIYQIAKLLDRTMAAERAASRATPLPPD